jgi:preprotein translocase subunit SecF
MIQIFANTHYDFIGKRRWAYGISVALLLVGLVSITVKGGLRYDIDFTGGTLIQVRFEKPPSVESIRSGLGRLGLGESVIQEYGDPREFVIRTQLVGANSAETGRQVQEALGAVPGLERPEIRRVEFVGPQVGHDLQLQAVYVVLIALAAMLAYIAIRFDLKGGVAAVVEVFHDVMICLGALSLTNREFSLAVLAGLLTIIGYSVNDTIVTYDRLREIRTHDSARRLSFIEQMNRAVNQTLSRTVLTVLTVVCTAATLFLFGGKALEDFAFVLLVGAITGTVSSVYVAGAIVADWTQYTERRASGPTGRAPSARAAR